MNTFVLTFVSLAVRIRTLNSFEDQQKIYTLTTEQIVVLVHLQIIFKQNFAL